MSNATELLTKITQKVSEIETKYPELYKYIDEQPITIPSEKNPDLDNKALKDYLESLDQLIKNYKETHAEK